MIKLPFADILTKFSFLCPIGSLFQQKTEVCDWWYNVNCSNTESFYGSREREGKHHENEELNEDSCLVLMAMDPLGQQGGSEQATGCERQHGIYDGKGLENVPTPYSRFIKRTIGAVNTCEEYCLKRAECEYYQFDCKLSLCTMKMGTAAGFLVNTRYITGNKNARALTLTGP